MMTLSIASIQADHVRIGSELPEETRQDLLGLLFNTYPVYIDRPSRHIVQHCLRSLLRYPVSPDDLKYLTHKLHAETSKSGLAPASAFTLVEWCSILLQHLSHDANTPLSAGLDIIAADAKALEICLAGSKSSVRQSALRVTRRALRAAFQSNAWGEDAVRQSVSRLTSDSTAGQRNAPFLGVISGVCARLPSRKPVLEESKKSILAFYVKELIGSRSVVPRHVANGLSDFFSSFVNYEDFTSELAPPIEKSILRAPEVVLSGLLSSLCSSLPADVDLSEVLHSSLLKHLLSSMKSTNATIRNGAGQSLESLLSRSKTESWLMKIMNEILSPLKTQKISNAEPRAVYSQALCSILPSVDLSKEVVQGLVPALSKESNEAALEQQISAFCKHLTLLIQSSVKISDEVVNSIVKGASDKRIPMRKLWQLNVGEVLWNSDSKAQISPETGALFSKFIAKMKELFNEIVSSPLPSAQNGSLSTAYIYLALLERASTLQDADKTTWENTVAQAMALTPKPSFLSNPRAYSKLSSQAEIQWVVRGLAAVTSGSKFEAAEDAAKIAWGQAFIFAITTSGLPTHFREQAVSLLSDVHARRPEVIGRILIDSLWAWILAFRTAEKESAPVSAGQGSEKNLHFVTRAICLPVPRRQESDGAVSHLREELVELLVLCRQPLISNVSWISLCLKTGTDPGNLVRQLPDKCLTQLTRVLEDPVQSLVPEVDAAIWSAAGDLAFVAPDTMVPHLVNQIQRDLDVNRILRFTPTDVAIARTPEGVMCVDVLSTKAKQPALDKSTKDYDTLKWEEELRTQLAEKKGQKPKKLNADEQQRVNAQLAKETKIRGEVLREVKTIERGAGIISGLARGPAIDSDGWINAAVGALLSLAQASVGVFVGDVVSRAYVTCAERLSTRLGALRSFVGVATLRAIDKTYLPPELEVEPLGGNHHFCDGLRAR